MRSIDREIGYKVKFAAWYLAKHPRHIGLEGIIWRVKKTHTLAVVWLTTGTGYGARNMRKQTIQELVLLDEASDEEMRLAESLYQEDLTMFRTYRNFSVYSKWLYPEFVMPVPDDRILHRF